MKLLAVLIILSGCASTELLEARKCIKRMDNSFGDVCAESSVGYELMNGSDAYYEGHKCAWEVAKSCVGEVK